MGVTGTTLRDLSGRNNHGTLTNMDPSTDWVIDGGQYALDFDGVNDYVAIPRPNSIAGSQSQYTMTAWVKFASGYAKLIDTGDFPNGLVVYVAVSSLNGGIQIGTGGTYPIFSTQRPIANVWFSVSVTVKNLNVALFLNGIQGASSTCASTPSFTSANWFFGGSGGAETLLGQADDLMFWNRALSANEIRQVYQLGRGGMYALRPPKKYWNFKYESQKPRKPQQIIIKDDSPSFETGFAPRDGEPLYPNLFKGLVGAWCPSMGVTGGTLRDLSGRNNHGTLTNMDPSTDWVITGGRYALDFEPSNDWVVCRTFFYNNVENSITGSAWVRIRNGYGQIGGCNYAAGFFWYAGLTGSSVPYQRIYAGGTYIDSFTGLTPNKWHHIAFTVNQKRLEIYIDGLLDGSGTIPSDPTFGTAFGAFGGDGSNIETLDGNLDNITLWNRSLTPNEIKQLYQLGRGGMFAMKSRKVSSSSPARIPKSRASLISRPPIEASYENGFAPRDGEPLYPNLFKGLIGAWVPSLGVTGRTLRDVSGRNNHGTLTNMDPASDWVIDDGQYALDFDGSNDYATTALSVPTSQMTFAVWAKPRSVGGVRRPCGDADAAAGTRGTSLIFFSTQRVYWVLRGGTALDLDVTGLPISTNQWTHVVCSLGDAPRMIVNGKLVGTGSGTTFSSFNGRWLIGSDEIGVTAFDGPIDDCIIWNRALSPNEASQLYQLGRGGMFRLSQPPQKKTISLPSTWLKVDNEWTEVQPNVVTASKASLITRPPIEPSYENGFAPRDGEPLYPNLFKGLVGAWCPSMGVTGNTLRDLSGRNNHGTLTNMDNATDWVIDGGQYALNFDWSNNRIDVGAIQLETRKTISCWIKRNGTETAVLFSVGQNIAPSGYIIGFIGSDMYNNNNGVFYSSAFGGLTAGRWEFLAIATDGANYTVYVNGVQKGTMQDAGANLLRHIGSYETGSFPFSGRLDDIAIWNRQLTASEIRQLYQLGRGGMFTFKPKTIALPTSTIWQPSQSRLYTGEWK